jgi:hypothetical protein
MPFPHFLYWVGKCPPPGVAKLSFHALILLQTWTIDHGAGRKYGCREKPAPLLPLSSTRFDVALRLFSSLPSGKLKNKTDNTCNHDQKNSFGTDFGFLQGRP